MGSTSVRNSLHHLRYSNRKPHFPRCDDFFRHSHLVPTFAGTCRLGPAVHHRFLFHRNCLAAAGGRLDLFRSRQIFRPSPFPVGAIHALRFRRVENRRRGGISFSSVDRDCRLRHHRCAVFSSSLSQRGLPHHHSALVPDRLRRNALLSFRLQRRPSCRAPAHQEFRSRESHPH